MDDFNTSFMILEGINQSGREIFRALGDHRYGFETRITELLDAMAEASDDDLDQLMQELVSFGLESPAAGIFEGIVIAAETGGLEMERPTLLFLANEWSPDTVRSAEGPEVLRTAANVLSGLIRPQELALDGGPKGLPKQRYLNAGFFSDDEQVPVDKPLVRDGTYRLGVNVGQFWGPGRPDVTIPEEVLEPHYVGAELNMHVAVRSFDIGIDPPTSPITVSQEGDSDLVFFDLTLQGEGRQALDVDLLLCGHLIQSRRLEVEVVADAGVELPESAWPVQNGYTTFTRMTALTDEMMEWLHNSPRRLTIVAEYDLNQNRIGLRFYDTDGDELGFQQSSLSTAALTKMLGALRDRLLTTMKAYAGGVGGPEEPLTKHLGLLASAGRRFYLALLPELAGLDDVADEGQRLKVDLQAGDVIQVAPLSGGLSVPWEMLYERKIEEYREDRIKLCSTFKEHGPALEDCPSHDDPKVVCPHGFWGYRYIVEQLPCRVEPGDAERPISLPRQIPNEIPSRVSLNVATSLLQLDANREALRGLASEERMVLAQADSLEKVKDELAEPVDIYYFYAHGGSDGFGSPYLEVGQGEQIKLIDLDAWEVRFPDQPLIFVNACESASYAPDDFENMISFLCRVGAAGVIGTQCPVRELLAIAFMREFFGRFFGQMPAGQAMYEARRTLLYDHLDPRGLVYSLFAAAEVELAQPISE